MCYKTQYEHTPLHYYYSNFSQEMNGSRYLELIVKEAQLFQQLVDTTISQLLLHLEIKLSDQNYNDSKTLELGSLVIKTLPIIANQINLIKGKIPPLFFDPDAYETEKPQKKLIKTNPPPEPKETAPPPQSPLVFCMNNELNFGRLKGYKYLALDFPLSSDLQAMCDLCGQKNNDKGLGQLYQLPVQNDRNYLVHQMCLLWTKGIKFTGKLPTNIKEISEQSKKSTCNICRRPHASIKCQRCPITYHFHCFMLTTPVIGCVQTRGNLVYCEQHKQKQKRIQSQAADQTIMTNQELDNGDVSLIDFHDLIQPALEVKEDKKEVQKVKVTLKKN